MKWKKVRVSQELLLDILHQHFPGRLPKDMMIWGTKIHELGIDFYLYSHKFDDLAEGLPAELMDITFDEFSTL